jgi:ATP-dependent RNA helicase DDX23/PRP28
MAGPLSVDEILAKQKADKDAAGRVCSFSSRCRVAKLTLQPKFLTKAERAALALEKRNTDVKAQQEREEVEKREREEFEKKAEEERRRSDGGRYGAGGPNEGRCELTLVSFRAKLITDGGFNRNDGYGGRNDGQGRHGAYGGQGGRNDGYGGQGGRNDGYGGGRDGGHGNRGGYGNGRDGGRDGRYGGPSGPSGPSQSNGPPTGPRGAHTPTGPRGANGHAPLHHSPLATNGSGAPASPKPTAPGDVAMPTDSELNTIRARYLGQKVDKSKPRLRKQTDKKLIFDWKAEDDTSGDRRIAVDPNVVLGRRPMADLPVAEGKDGNPGTAVV